MQGEKWKSIMNIVHKQLSNSTPIWESCGDCPWISVPSLGKNISSDVFSQKVLDESIIKISTLPLVFPGSFYSSFPKQIHWNRKTLCILILICKFPAALSLPTPHTEKSEHRNCTAEELDLGHIQESECVKETPRPLPWVTSTILLKADSCIENMLIHKCTVLLTKTDLISFLEEILK